MRVYEMRDRDCGLTLVGIEVDRFRSDGSLAMMLIDPETSEPWCMLTRCLEHPGIELRPNEAFVDVNNLPFAEGLIADNALGVFTGVTVWSGYREYPLVAFDMGRVS